MALIICTECGKEYSSLAQACPNCGCPTHIADAIEQKQSITAPKKIDNYNINISETDDGVVKTYKRLPSVPYALTIIGLVIIPLSMLSMLYYFSVTSLVDSWMGETFVNDAYFTDGQLISVLLFSTWTIISMIGIIRLKQWGMISYICCKGLDILITLLCMHQWGITWIGIIYSLMMTIIYLCTFMFETSGHNAFEILMHNGVIEEKSTDKSKKQI